MHQHLPVFIPSSTPPAPAVIEAIALLVTTGLILGFAIKGEIALGGEVGVINNLAG